MFAITSMIIIPGLLWGCFFYYLHRYKRPNVRFLLLLFLAGMGCGLIALLLNHSTEKYTMFWPGAVEMVSFLGGEYPLYRHGFWLLVGFNEETAKLLILLLIAYPSRSLQEPFDGILSAAIIALGFATLENLFYFQQYGISVVTTRSLVTMPAHAFMSVPMGYFTARSRIFCYQTQRKNLAMHYYVPMLYLLLGWLISSILHGLYDFWLSIDLDKIAYTQIVLMGIFAIGLGVRTWQESLYFPHSHPSFLQRFRLKK